MISKNVGATSVHPRTVAAFAKLILFRLRRSVAQLCFSVLRLQGLPDDVRVHVRPDSLRDVKQHCCQESGLAEQHHTENICRNMNHCRSGT